MSAFKKDFEEYAANLAAKVAHIPPHGEHIMPEVEYRPLDIQLAQALSELDEFVQCDLADLEKYEKWIEEQSGPNQAW